MAAVASSNNSTNVRFAPRPVRLGFRVLSWLAPGEAERRAAVLFRTPRRPAKPSAPRVPGYSAHASTTLSQGLALPTWSFGQGSRVALLVHGWSGHAGQMARFVRPLVERDFRVVVFDQPAHGAAEGREATVLDFAQAVADVARTHDARVIVAHSLGATATALAMARHAIAPEAVVLYAPAAAVPPYLHRLAKALELPPERETGLFTTVRHEMGVDLDTLDLRRFASSMSVPALFVHDPEDDETSFDDTRTIAEAWPGARMLAPSGIGHRDGLRDPSVIEAAAEFVTEVSR